MHGNSDAKHRDVDGAPFYPNGYAFVFHNNGNPIDDDLHEELGLYARSVPMSSVVDRMVQAILRED